MNCSPQGSIYSQGCLIGFEFRGDSDPKDVKKKALGRCRRQCIELNLP